VVSSDSPVELPVRAAGRTAAAELIVNARVAAEPELLRALAEQAVSEAAAAAGAAAQPLLTRSLRPGRPVPTHRFAEPI